MSAHANTGTVLDRILESRRAEVDHRKRVLPETALKYGVKAATPLRNFAAWSTLSADTLRKPYRLIWRTTGAWPKATEAAANRHGAKLMAGSRRKNSPPSTARAIRE